MIRIIFDWPCSHGSVCSDMFIVEMKKHGKDLIVDGARRAKPRVLFWLLLAIRTIFKSKKEDIIVTWLDTLGVFCYWVGKLTNRKRKILALNILLKEKTTFKNRLWKTLYNIAIDDYNFYFTYTSKWQKWNTYPRAFYLQDTYVDRDALFVTYKDCGKTVFVGGWNGRDWPLAIQVAKRLPSADFYFVCPPMVEKLLEDKTNNIHVGYALPRKEYLKTLAECSIVFLPLDTNAPAGLIVLYEAAMKCKALVMTENDVSKDYLVNQSLGLLVTKNDVDDAVEKLETLLDNEQKRESMSKELQSYIMENRFFP